VVERGGVPREAAGDELEAFLGSLKHTSEQPDAAGFVARSRAIDALELHASEPRHAGVVWLRDRLQRINDSMVQRLRERIAAGSIAPGELLATFQQYVSSTRSDAADDLEYDALDALVAGLCGTDRFVEDGAVALDPEMVPYQPTPARLVLALVEELRPDERDVFVDVGAGLGTIPMLVSMLTPARAVGIEFHPKYCEFARQCARSLNLSSVSFVQQDAREADFSTGTIFYMYTPFKGEMLRDVLRRLENEGRSREIGLCTYGPLLLNALREFPTFSMTTAGRGRQNALSVFRCSLARNP
jgi:hypothetical protein